MRLRLKHAMCMHLCATRAHAYDAQWKACWRVPCRVWSMASGAGMQTLQGHTEQVCCLSLSADGTTLLSGSDDYTQR